MSPKSFVIKETDWSNFAKLSGDKNAIHLSKITGYNSIYGYSIPHGVLIILVVITCCYHPIPLSDGRLSFQH